MWTLAGPACWKAPAYRRRFTNSLSGTLFPRRCGRPWYQPALPGPRYLLLACLQAAFADESDPDFVARLTRPVWDRCAPPRPFPRDILGTTLPRHGGLSGCESGDHSCWADPFPLPASGSEKDCGTPTRVGPARVHTLKADEPRRGKQIHIGKTIVVLRCPSSRRHQQGPTGARHGLAVCSA